MKTTLNVRKEQLKDIQELLESDIDNLTSMLDHCTTKNIHVARVDGLKHILFLEDQQAYLYCGKVIIPIDPTENISLNNSDQMLKKRIESRYTQLKGLEFLSDKMIQISESIEKILLSKNLPLHGHRSEKAKLPFGISIPENSDSLYVNFKKKQKILNTSGANKKVTLSLKVPFDIRLKAKFVAQKVFSKSEEHEKELEMQQLHDIEPKLIQAVVKYKKEKTKADKISVYETLFQYTLIHPEIRKLPYEKMVTIALNLVDQLIKIQAKGYLHGDIKLGNVLVNSDLMARFTDFGFTFKANDVHPPGDFNIGFYGSIYNTPPEMYGKQWSKQSKTFDPFLAETFAFAVSLWTWIKEKPFWAKRLEETHNDNVRINELSRLNYYKVLVEYIENQNKNSKNELERIVLKMMDPFPNQRMTLTQAKEALENLGK